MEDAEVGGAVIGACFGNAAADAGGNPQGTGPGADPGFDIRVLAIARHEELGRSQAEAFQHHLQHVGIGLAEDTSAGGRISRSGGCR